MSLSSRTVVNAVMYRAGATPKVGYTNENDGVTPLCHVGIFSGPCFDCRRSLLISIRTWRGMPLTDRLERGGASFLFSPHVVLWGWQIRKLRAARG